MHVAASPNSGAVEAPPTKQVSSPDRLANKSFSDFNALLSLLIGGAADDQSTQLASDSGNSKKNSTDWGPDKRRDSQLDPNASLGLGPASQVLPQQPAMPDPSLTAQSRTVGPVPVHPRGAGLADQLQVNLPGPMSDPQAQQILGDLAGVRKAALNQTDPMAFAAQLTEFSKADKNAQGVTPALKPASAEGIDGQGSGNSPKVKELLQSTLKIPIQQKDANGGSQNSSDNSRQFLKQSATGKDAPKEDNSSNLTTDGGIRTGYDGSLHPLEATPRQDTLAKVAQPSASSQPEQLESKSEINQTLRPQPVEQLAIEPGRLGRAPGEERLCDRNVDTR